MVLFTVVLILLAVGSVYNLDIEGYYWREYAGLVPKDALPGGEDYNGNPIYMGQIWNDGRLTPAKIYPYDNKAYYAWGKELSGTNDIKILCTQHPERFVWVKTKHNEIHLLTNHHIVVAGRHPGKTMHFGRVHHRMETSVGKVSAGPNEDRGLFITQNGTEFNYLEFEILTYNRSMTPSLKSHKSLGSACVCNN